MAKREIKFGMIGCGLIGREFASASARWCHLLDMDFVPTIVAVCDVNPAAMEWFSQNFSSVRLVTADYHDLLNDSEVEAIYCAVPHNLHEQFYGDILRAGKHLLGEKPFGIDLKANEAINSVIAEHPDLLVRCSSEFPFYPGAYTIADWIREGRFGQIIEVEVGFWHCSDLDPRKKINWKRMIDLNGEYGCMGDLGMHVLHLPLRFGWKPKAIQAQLANVVRERPDVEGRIVPCETWDNAILIGEVEADGQQFPLIASTKRIAPGHVNTWIIRVIGTEFSAEYSTKNPKELRYLPYAPGDDQAWRAWDVPFRSAYPTITGPIFEFGFSDAILQMWAAYSDELVHGDQMGQPLSCVTPEEATSSHQIFTAALESQRTGRAVAIEH